MSAMPAARRSPRRSPADASPDAAVAAAADDILDILYRAQSANFDAQLAASLAALPAGQG